MESPRRALLTAAVGFTLLEFDTAPPPVVALHAWLSTWSGIGHVTHGMAPAARSSRRRSRAVHTAAWRALAML